MAIATRQETPVVNSDPKTISQVYDTITDDPIDSSVKCLAKDLEGTPLVTTYYAQRLGRDDKFSFQDINLSPSYQSYNKISGLVINVTEAPDFTIDSITGVATGKGVAVVAAYMKFNPGDAFYANAINNEMTLFKVDEVELTSVHRNAPYQISYSLVGPTTEASLEIIDLDEKSFKTYFYDEDYVSTCSGPILSEEESEEKGNLEEAYDSIMREYLRLFTDKDTDALILDIAGTKIFDPFLHRFMMQTVPTDYQLRRSLRGFNTHDLDRYTLFSFLIEPHLLDYSCPTTDFALKAKESYSGTRSSMYLSFTTVEYFVDSEGDVPMESVNPLTFYTGQIDVDGVPTNLLPDLTDGSYMVPPAFYEGTTTSILEEEIQKFIDREPLDSARLLSLAKSYKLWSLTEKFYLGSVLTLLLKVGTGEPC